MKDCVGVRYGRPADYDMGKALSQGGLRYHYFLSPSRKHEVIMIGRTVAVESDKCFAHVYPKDYCSFGKHVYKSQELTQRTGCR